MEQLFTIARKDGSGAIIWTENQKRYIIQHYRDYDETISGLAELFQVRPEAIRNLLRKEKVSITDKHIRNFPRNSNFFMNIDTPEKAYWLGMFYADGTVSNKGNKIALYLKDEEGVKHFRAAIEAHKNEIIRTIDKRYEPNKTMYGFSINDKQLHADLISWGCVPDKTHQELHFPNIPEELKWHFIRGYFDGDGCLSYSIARKSYTLSFIGSKSLMEDFRIFFEKTNVALQKNIKSEIAFSFRLSGRRQVLSCLEKIYENSTDNIRLERKYQHYQKLLSSSPAICS